MLTSQEDDKAKARNVSKVPLLQPTRNPTEVIDHWKAVCVALHADGFGRGVDQIDPRTNPPFIKYQPREFDPIRDNMSPAAAALTEAQRESATGNNVARFENERRRQIEECERETRRIYYLVRATLSPASLGKVKTINLQRFEDAEVQQDTGYLVGAVIASHSSTSTTGLSVFAIQRLLRERVAAYATCVKGSMTLEKYLEVMNGHIAAIKSMDANVAADGTGGYLGSKSDQVAAFLSGTGASLIINLHLNSRLPVDKVPHSLEEVCTLLTNWVGPIYESDGDKRPAASIMASSGAESETIHAYSTEPQVKNDQPKQKYKFRPLESVAERAKRNQEALTEGVAVPPRATWTSNRGAPVPPLVRTTTSTTEGDYPCENCRGYHPCPQTNRPTLWYLCPVKWDAICVRKDNVHQTHASKRTGKAPNGGRAATIAVAQEAPPAAAQAAAPQHAGWAAEYSAAEHAAAMSVRAATTGQPHYQSYHAYRPPPGQWVQYNALPPPARHNTDDQGWTVPWEDRIDRYSFMIRTVTTGVDEVTTAHQPIDHLVKR